MRFYAILLFYLFTIGEAALWVNGQDLRTITSFIVACEACISVRTLAVWWNFTVAIMYFHLLLAGTLVCPAQKTAVGRTESDLAFELRRHCVPFPGQVSKPSKG